MAKTATPATAAANKPPTVRLSAPLAGLNDGGAVPDGEVDGAPEAVPAGVEVLATGYGAGTKVGAGGATVGGVVGVVVGMYGVIGTVGMLTELAGPVSGVVGD